ncbi:MAG: hypothetical protein ACPGEF_04210, partial [Endozoicomonas sp.]
MEIKSKQPARPLLLQEEVFEESPQGKVRSIPRDKTAKLLPASNESQTTQSPKKLMAKNIGIATGSEVIGARLAQQVSTTTFNEQLSNPLYENWDPRKTNIIDNRDQRLVSFRDYLNTHVAAAENNLGDKDGLDCFNMVQDKRVFISLALLTENRGKKLALPKETLNSIITLLPSLSTKELHYQLTHIAQKSHTAQPKVEVKYCIGLQGKKTLLSESEAKKFLISVANPAFSRSSSAFCILGINFPPIFSQNTNISFAISIEDKEK